MYAHPYSQFNLTGGLFKDPAAASQIQSGLSCVHLEAYKDEEMIGSYEILYAFYVAFLIKGSAEKKVKDCVCHKCEKEKNPSERKLFRRYAVHACLSCVYFGCFKGKCHIMEHSRKTEHPLAMDTDCGQVYCFECRDYVYDMDFIKIAEELSAMAKRKENNMKSLVKPVTGKPDKWEPSPDLVEILQYHEIVYNSEFGIRGLVNTGNFTCYLNAVIQCLIHAPVFRDYLLSYTHKGKTDIIKDPKRQLCLVCQMADVVQESFARKKPFILAKVLVAFFKRCNQYAKDVNQFQDAHDFFNDLIVNFHEDEIGEITPRDISLTFDMVSPCDCIIHKIFGLVIQKEQNCQYCKHQCIVEKNLKHPFIFLKQLQTKNVTLTECLESTLKDEMNCIACKKPCMVQSIPVQLPHVLNICSNQFDYKKDMMSYLKFEETLDLSPFIMPSWKTKEDSLTDHAYYLFGVVEYDRQHYRCYIKKNKDQWYECDNETIDPITLPEVLQISGRLFFYHKMYM